MQTRYDVIGLGVATLDHIGVAGAEPLLGAKQPLAGWIEAGGGPVATALVALARLGGRGCLVSTVGDDSYGPRIVAGLQEEGVSTEGVVVRPGGSHVAFVLAEPGSGRRTIWWHHDRAVIEGFVPSRELVQSARALLLDTHLSEAGALAASWMHERGGLVMIDAERHTDAALSLLPLCDYIVASERFGRAASGEEDPALAALALQRRYGRIVVITAGERGSWCAAPGEQFHTPAFPIHAVDTTGAGDVFHGGLLYALLQGRNLRAALRFASATAALKCRAPGGRAGIPNLAEVEALLAG
jgi:ribokinase